MTNRGSPASLGAAFAAGALVSFAISGYFDRFDLQSQRSRFWFSPWIGFAAFVDRALKFLGIHSTFAKKFSSRIQEAEPLTVVEGIEGTIGNTPLLRIKSLSEATGCDILAKAEFLNGAGNSTKDRVALGIITEAEESGLLTPYSGDTIYEGTVGSTGISLAAICRAKGYNAHICMPDDQAEQKYSLLKQLGAVVDKVRPVSIVNPEHFVNRARALAESHGHDPDRPGRGLFANQFETEANWRVHYNTTGPEILAQTSGRQRREEMEKHEWRPFSSLSAPLDAFVAGAGTGGTISGVALYLKPRVPGLKVVLADPQGSGLYNRIKYGVMFNNTEREGRRGRHQVDTIVEGIGMNRQTVNFEAGRALIDDAIRVTDEQALRMARWLVEWDGIFIGSSSAVNCVAATKLALQLGPGHRIVTLLCDPGTRHLSKFWAAADKLHDSEVSTLEAVLGLPTGEQKLYDKSGSDAGQNGGKSMS